jgi:hypothetical protein
LFHLNAVSLNHRQIRAEISVHRNPRVQHWPKQAQGIGDEIVQLELLHLEFLGSAKLHEAANELRGCFGG